MQTYVSLWSYLAQFFLEWEIFQTKVIRKVKTKKIVFNKVIFFRKSRSLWGNVGKYCRSGQATGDNMAQAHFVLDT